MSTPPPAVDFAATSGISLVDSASVSAPQVPGELFTATSQVSLSDYVRVSVPQAVAPAPQDIVALIAVVVALVIMVALALVLMDIEGE